MSVYGTAARVTSPLPMASPDKALAVSLPSRRSLVGTLRELRCLSHEPSERVRNELADSAGGKA
mgnify:CR=1 FL=1